MVRLVAFGLLALAVAQAAVVPQNEPEEVDESWFPREGEDPVMMAGKFEGDMVIDENSLLDKILPRNAMKSTYKLWPNGVVYYTLDESYPSYIVSVIESAFREMEDKTKVNGKYCVRFLKRTSENDYIRIRPISGCYSLVGRKGGYQDLSIARGCTQKGTIMHELKHALGFYHEQSRNDRDNYITVDYSNVQSGKASQFKRMSLNEIQQFTPYDYGSLMHYGAYSFAADRSKPTIIPKKAGVTIGQRIRLSDYDIQEIRTLYSCGGTSTSTGGSVTQPPVVTNQPTTGSVSGLPKGTCTFESGLCGWTQDTYDSHDWTIRSGSTPSGSTGPTSAYGGSGKYVYVEASGYSNKIARLVSPMLTTTGATPFCLRFNYHMYGADMGRLTIGSKFGTTYRPIVYFSGDKGTSWRTARFTINTSSAGSFSFYLEGTVGTNYRSDIAIDNLNLASGKCT